MMTPTTKFLSLRIRSRLTEQLCGNNQNDLILLNNSNNNIL